MYTWQHARITLRPTADRTPHIYATVCRRRFASAAWPTSTSLNRRRTMTAPKSPLRCEAGIALLTTILLMLLMSSLLFWFVLLITQGQKMSGLNNDYSRAFYAS